MATAGRDPRLSNVSMPPVDTDTGTDTDVVRRCSGCGYDLRGQRLDGRCPECGLPLRVERRGDDEPLSRMPIGVVRRLRHGGWLCTLAVVGVLVTVVASRPAGVAANVRASVLMGLAVVWVLGTFAFTPAFDDRPAVMRGFSSRGRLRRVARWGQLVWLIASGANMAIVFGGAALTGAVPGQLRFVMFASIVGGILAGMLLAVLLARLAEWACDRDAERALNLSLWAVPIATGGLLFSGAPTRLVFQGASVGLVMAAVIFILWAGAVLAFPYGLISLSRSVEWSVRHAAEYEDRLRRRRERQDKYDREVGSSVESMDAARAAREATASDSDPVRGRHS